MAAQKEGETTPRRRGRGTAKIEAKEKKVRGTAVAEKRALRKPAEERESPLAPSNAAAPMAIEKTMVSPAEAVEKKIEPGVSNKSRLVALLLCFFLGWAGGHRFYAKKIGTGITMLFTMGGFGMWYFLDLVLIISGVFKDKNSLPIKRWI